MLVYVSSAGESAIFAAGDYIVYILHGMLHVDVLLSMSDFGRLRFNLVSYNFSAADSVSSRIRPTNLRFPNRLPVDCSSKNIRAVMAEVRCKHAQLIGYTYMRVIPSIKCRIWHILQAIHKHMY